MSPGRSALLVSTLSVLTPSSHFPLITSATFAVFDLIFNLQNNTAPPRNLNFFSSLKHRCLRQLTVTPFSVPSYFLYSHFRSKAGCCVYVRNDITCSRAHALESSKFSTIWLRLQSHYLTKFFCAVYLSPNSSDYRKFFDYLTSKVEHILTLFPFAEISILGDFNVHHQLWLSSPFTDHPGELAYNFAILHDLEQLVQHPTRIPDGSGGNTCNILDLFSTSNSFAYIITPSSSLGSYGHNPISLTFFLFIQFPPQNPPQRRWLFKLGGAEETL